MTPENKPAIVTDTGSSIRPDSPQAKEYQIISAPLDITFYENGQPVTFPDSDISPAEFYSKMASSKELPKTSGAIPEKLKTIYNSCVQENRSVISIHITSRHSAVYDSAILAKNEIQNSYPELFDKKNPQLFIDVIDSRQVSIATWFLVEQAAILANEGYPLKDITRIILETIPKVEIFTTLNDFENVVKGGRLSTTVGAIGNGLHVKPFINVLDGELKLDILRSRTLTNKHRRQRLVDKVEKTKGKIIKLAVVHTNYPDGAEELKKSLSQIYSGEIGIYEAGPVLGVHAGEKGLGIALQKA